MLFLVIAISLVTGLGISFFFLGLGRIADKTQEEEKFRQMIDAITQSEIQIEREDSNTPDPKTWAGYWYKLAVSAGYAPVNTSAPSYIAIGLPVIGFLVGWLVIPQDIVVGILLAGALMFLVRFVLKFQGERRITALNKQLPTLLAGLRASLQATLTPQQAIIAQADEIASPLGDELKILRAEISVNISLDTALSNLALRVPSRELKFLMSAIRIAITSGTDLDPLIAIIQTIVVQRARIANHLASAVAQVQPSIWVTGVMIPAGFAFSYLSSESNKAFWGTLPGLVAAGIVSLLYGLGLFISKKQIDRVKDA